jgi:hypothetical protein
MAVLSTNVCPGSPPSWAPGQPRQSWRAAPAIATFGVARDRRPPSRPASMPPGPSPLSASGSGIGIPSGARSRIGGFGERARLITLPRLRGMGAVDPGTAEIGNIAAQGAATTGVILSGLAAPGIAALSPTFAIAGPIGIAAAALISIGFLIAGKFSGCGQTCVDTSNLANEVGDYLTKNLNAYMAAPVHYRSLWLAALNNYDFGWAALAKACGNPAYQQAGVNCIADRQQGACFFHAAYAGKWAPDSSGRLAWTGYGPPVTDGGVCWNYFIGMRDPIVNDPTVVDDPVPAGSPGSFVSSLFSPSAAGGGFSLSDLVVPAGLIAAGLML